MDVELRKHSSQGFTMAELLIVVAIIAVLVAIAIPVFTTQLEKSRQAVDLANARSAYAALQITRIEGTNPDGSDVDNEGWGAFFYVFTGNGFKAFSDTNKDEALELKSRSDPSFLGDLVSQPSDIPLYSTYPNLQSVNGCYLVALKYESNDSWVTVLAVLPGELLRWY